MELKHKRDTMLKTTSSEEKAKILLEHCGWNVLKPSYPDFIIYRDSGEGREWAFVEVKRHFGERSDNQRSSFRVLQETIGIPIHVVEIEDYDEAFWKERISQFRTTQNFRLAEVLHIRTLMRRLHLELEGLDKELEKIDSI